MIESQIFENSSLRIKRCLFTILKARLELWINDHSGWEVNESEGYVKDTDASDGDYDGPHLRKGGHYTGLACDLNVFLVGILLEKGDHPVWKEIGMKWESMHPLCRWGGHFGDGNHISLIHQGVK